MTLGLQSEAADKDSAETAETFSAEITDKGSAETADTFSAETADKGYAKTAETFSAQADRFNGCRLVLPPTTDVKVTVRELGVHEELID